MMALVWVVQAKNGKEEGEQGEEVGEERKACGLVEELGARQTAARIERPEMKPKVEGKTWARRERAVMAAIPSFFRFFCSK